MRPKRFSGAIRLGETQANVKFRAEVSAAGVAKLLFDPIPRNDSTEFLIASFQNQRNEMRYFDFTLNGESRDGSTFHSASMQIHKLDGLFSTISSPAMTLSAMCLECTITSLSPPRKRPAIKAFLIGFDIAKPVFSTCPLGTVELRGPATLTAADKRRLTGELIIEEPAPGEPFETWKSKALALFVHVESIMSFARGSRLSAPITEVAYEGRVEMTIAMVIVHEERREAVFSPIDYRLIFRQAVASRFFEASRAKKISLAISWFNMPSNYREAKLISAMTVLENLLTENLHPSMFTSRTKSQSKQLRHAILRTVQSKLEEFGLGPKAIETELKFMTPKLEDLNRRTLLEKISMLANDWGVPMEDIVERDLVKAKQARDWIVHQGQCRKEDSAEDLMRHVWLIRELVVRFILTALAFEGLYASPMARDFAYHRIMPPRRLE